MNKEPLKRWHGAHHYSDKIHLFLVIFLIFGMFTLFWSYFTLSDLRARITISPATKEVKTKIVPTAVLTPTPTRTPTPNTTISPTVSKTNVVCTMEARLCPDGKTWVGRTGPNCEFSKCP